MLSKRIEDAREKVDLVLSLEPENIEALLMLGGLYGAENNISEAESTFKKVLEIDSRQTRAYYGLSRIFAVQGKLDEAERALQQAVDINPTNLNVRLVLFNFYFHNINLQIHYPKYLQILFYI